MTEIDLLLRGGTLALAAFLILRLALAHLPSELRLSGTAFLIGVIGYSLAVMPGGTFDTQLTFTMARICGVAFWWFSLCLFDAKPPHRLTAALFAAFLLNPHVTPPAFSNIVHQALTATLLGHVIYRALSGLGEDLVPQRRAFRITVGLLLPLTGFIIVWFETIPPPPMWEPALLLLQSAAYMVFALSFAVWMTSLDISLFTPAPPRGGTGTGGADKADLDRISALMASGIHREEGLTIASMATRLDLPEHRLRKLINTHLGYRNFSELVNDLRIDDAKNQLSDPGTARRQISQIAHTSGYASLAPFNRAFRARTGQSPSEFRRDALDLPR